MKQQTYTLDEVVTTPPEGQLLIMTGRRDRRLLLGGGLTSSSLILLGFSIVLGSLALLCGAMVCAVLSLVVMHRPLHTSMLDLQYRGPGTLRTRISMRIPEKQEQP